MTGPRTAQPKSRWKTVRCVVEYRTQSDISDRDLSRHVQDCLVYSARFAESKMWAKGFSSVMSRMEGGRPKRLQAVIRSLDAALTRLRKL